MKSSGIVAGPYLQLHSEIPKQLRALGKSQSGTTGFELHAAELPPTANQMKIWVHQDMCQEQNGLTQSVCTNDSQ